MLRLAEQADAMGMEAAGKLRRMHGILGRSPLWDLPWEDEAGTFPLFERATVEFMHASPLGVVATALEESVDLNRKTRVQRRAIRYMF